MSHLTKAVWGPPCWAMMHSLAASVDASSRDAFCRFLHGLSALLPCPECKQHFQDFLAEHPPETTVRDRESASRYCFDLHNRVNDSLGKPQAPPLLIRSRYGVSLQPLTVPRVREDFPAAPMGRSFRVHPYPRMREYTFR